MYGLTRFPRKVRALAIILRSAAERLCEAIRDYLPRILRQIATLEEAITGFGSQPVIVNDVMQRFAFDSMGEFAFNESFGMTKSGKMHRAIEQQRSAISLLGPLSPAIWVPMLAFAFVPFYWRIRDWNGMVAFCDNRLEKRLKVGYLSLAVCLALLSSLSLDKSRRAGHRGLVHRGA